MTQKQTDKNQHIIEAKSEFASLLLRRAVCNMAQCILRQVPQLMFVRVLYRYAR